MYEQEKTKNIAKIKLDNQKISHMKGYLREPSRAINTAHHNRKKIWKNMGKDKDQNKNRKSEGFSVHFSQRNVTNMPLTTASRRVARPVPLIVRMPAPVEL